jgi:probable HAF family extracellular repeat protein
MIPMILRTVLTAIALSTALSGSFAGSIEYTIQDLGVLPSAPSNGGSHPTAMNSAGEVVGYGDIYTDYSHAFLYAGSGSPINLGSFGGDYSVSVATSINSSGMVVGYSDSSGMGNPTRAFVYTQAKRMQDLGTFGGQQAYADSINDAGQVVGYAQDASGLYHGFIYSGNGPMVDLGSTYIPELINNVGQVVAIAGSGTSVGTYISSGGTNAWVSIGSLGGQRTQPSAINASGEIVGFSTTTPSGTDQAAFLYSGGILTNLGSFGGTEGSANGVNDEGVAVGYSALPGDSISHAFIFGGTGPIQDLNSFVDPTLGWTLDDAVSINDHGEIAVEGYLQRGPDHALLLTPVSEPGSVSLSLVAVFVVVAVRAGVALRSILKFDDVGCELRDMPPRSFSVQEVRSCLAFEVWPSLSQPVLSGLRGAYLQGIRSGFWGGFGW